MENALRFLDLVRRELRCVDAYFQLGGEAPNAAERLHVELESGWRIVARFDAAPEPHARAKLEALVASFSGLTREAQLGPTLTSPPPGARAWRREIDEALTLLATKAGALLAVVIDEDSPVLWGSSAQPSLATDIEVAIAIAELVDSASAAGLDLVELVNLEEAALELRLAGLESDKLRQRLLRKLPRVRARGPERTPEQWATHFLGCRAIAAIRRAPEHHKAMLPDIGWLAREFAGIYHVILVFDGPFDELHATPPLQRAVPAVERLVLALPPVDPPPGSARVLRLL